MNMDFMRAEDRNKFFKWSLIAVVLLSIFLAVKTLDAFKDLWLPNPAQNTISVTGEGEVVSVPDIASFTFSVSADANTVSEAQEQVTAKINKVLGSLKELGIEEKDIKTTDYSIYPRYSYSQAPCSINSCPPSRQILNGYTSTHTISVKLRDTEKAGQALAVVGENGATNVSGISFTAEDPNAVIQEARGIAIKDAREKAKQLSKNLDVRLVRVVSFYDNMGGQPVPYGYGMGSDTAVMKEVVQSAPTIPQGENKVKVSVTVVYEIR